MIELPLPNLPFLNEGSPSCFESEEPPIHVAWQQKQKQIETLS